MLLVAINVEPTMLGEMLLEMDEPLPPVGPTPRGISTTPMSEELGGAVIRLLECLKSPLDSRMLGRQTVREIVYRVLCGEQGGSLRALASRDDHFARIARVLKHIHAEYAKPLSAEELARRAGMSVSAFHHNFKLVTASSPLQYLKRIRLDHAQAADGPRRLQREHRREGGRVREPVAVQPGVQAALRRDARRGGRADASPARGRLISRQRGQHPRPHPPESPGNQVIRPPGPARMGLRMASLSLSRRLVLIESPSVRSFGFDVYREPH